MTVLGPGTLKFGEVGSEIDVSCNVNSCSLTASKDQGDSKTMLCGTSKPGSVTYSWALTGNVDIDLEAGVDGLFGLSQVSPGTQVKFDFIPNTEEGTAASGTVVIDPLDFGADEYGADLSSDFEFAVVDKPTWVWGTVAPPLAAADQAAMAEGEAAPEPATA